MNNDEVWEWIDRELTPEFFTKKNNLTPEHVKIMFDEIPDELKLLAITMIQFASSTCEHGKGGKTPNSCQFFRNGLFLMSKALEKNGIDLHLPHYWYEDGVMIEPEWIVRITNGIVQWTCDSSREQCGLYKNGKCRFANDGI